MSTQTVEQMCFGFFPRLPIVVEPTEAQLSSDVGILPIRQFDDQIGFTQRFIACLNDPRDPDQIAHPFDEMVRQRVYGVLAGYEDGNDHDALRADPVFKLVGGRTPQDDDLASQPTLSRFENAIDIPSLWRLHDFFIDDFIRSFDHPPSSLTLDLDAVDDPCHGGQQLALFHGFYEQYQYLPIVISCAETKQVLWVAVRPGSVHAALGADDDLEYIVNRLRAAWPDVVIHVRGDAGFGVPWMYAVCERLSCHRFLANYFRLMLHAAALNLPVQLRARVADPPTLLAHDAPAWQQLEREERINYVPVDDPTLPVAALPEPERRRYQNYRRQKDPLGQGHIETWRLMLIKVAGEVIQSARRILIRIPAHWPYLGWFQEVCRRLNQRQGSAQVQT